MFKNVRQPELPEVHPGKTFEKLLDTILNGSMSSNGEDKAKKTRRQDMEAL